MADKPENNVDALKAFKELAARLPPDQQAKFQEAFLIIQGVIDTYGGAGILALGIIGVTLSLQQERIADGEQAGTQGQSPSPRITGNDGEDGA